MKKILTLTFFVFSMMNAISQTDGITYQAVIIAPEDLELPGVDSEGNYLPNTTIAIRFTIYDSGNQLEFQEVQITETDDFGRINLLIGEAEHDYFKEIELDQFTAEVFTQHVCTHIETIVRQIPSKRMPSKNSPTNKVGLTVTTINNEYIVVMEKK